MSWRRRSYEVLPALSVRGAELRRSLRLVTISWMFGIIWMSLVAGSRVNFFGRMIGFTDFHFGVLSAVPFIATFGQILAAIFVERTGLTKYQFLSFGVVHRMLWLVVAAIPILSLLPLLPSLPAAWAVWTMLAVLAVSWFMCALCTPAWWTWMGDLIPKRIRGRYFAARARYTRAIQIPVVIGLAIWLDRTWDAGAPMTAADQPALLWSICAVFAVAAIFGTIDILCFRNMREVVPTVRDGLRRPAISITVRPRSGRGAVESLAYAARYVAAVIGQALVEPLKDKMFRRYVLVGATITFNFTVAGPFFLRQLLECLKFSQLGADFLFMVLGPTVSLLAVKVWGGLIDRWGRRPILMFGSALTIFSLVPYFLSSPNTPNPQFVIDGANRISGAVGWLFGRPDWEVLSAGVPVGAWLIMSCSLLIGGCGWSAIGLAQNNIILGFADGHGRSKYIAASAVLISAGGIVGGLTGGIVARSLDFLQESPIVIGPFLYNNWHATFLLSIFARILTLLWVVRMPDPGSRRVRDLMRHASYNVYNNVASRLFYPLRIFGWTRGRPRGPDNSR